MWYNSDLDVLEYNIFSVVPDVSASGQLNVFSCIRCHNIYFSHVHKFFFVSVG